LNSVPALEVAQCLSEDIARRPLTICSAIAGYLARVFNGKNMRSKIFWLLMALITFATQAQSASRPAPIEAVRSALRAGNVEAATEAANLAITALPGAADAWYFAAAAYGQMAQSASIFSKLSWAKKCLHAYEQALRIDPGHIDANMELLQFYLVVPGIAGGSREKADAQVARIAKLDAGWGYAARSRVARVDKDEVAYEREAKSAIAASPGEARHRAGYALMLAKKQRWEDAFCVVDEGLAVAPDDTRLNYQIGRLAALSGKQLERGLMALQRARNTSNKPDDYSEGAMLWRRGQILEKLGRGKEALPDYRRALQLEPNLKEQIALDIERVENG